MAFATAFGAPVARSTPGRAAAMEDGLRGPFSATLAEDDQARPTVLRVLVAIASYGEKNLGFLATLIERYQSMSMAVDVLVLSEAPKRLPATVQVVVGLPVKNPWSLPFGHKQVFARNLERYDLFVYSEDDIEVTEQHLQAFIRATKVLPSNNIAGFLRVERSATGAGWMPDAHGPFRWKPESVSQHDGLVFAEYTNEHAAFFVLTRAQLRDAIASGGFLRAPHEGRYDMLCTAATDPYTSCGLRKVICVSELDAFLVHHMSNRYVGQMGMPLAEFKEQAEVVKAIAAGRHPATTLCEVESKLPKGEWSKACDERANAALLSMVPDDARTVLSIGCGSGATELALHNRGLHVSVLPVDSVMGAAVARRGLTAIYGELMSTLADLNGQAFDCVLVTNLLHLQSQPEEVFRRCVALVRPGGAIVIDSPNFDRARPWVQRTIRRKQYGSFAESGISVVGPGALKGMAWRSGCSRPELRWYDHALPRTFGLRRLPLRAGRITASGSVFRAIRNRPS